MNIQKKLDVLIKQGYILENAPMGDYTTFRAGGCADLLVVPGSEAELAACIALLADEGLHFMVMGNGSNVLVRDGGYRGIILRLSDCCDTIRGEGPAFEAGAACSLAEVARYVQARGYTGFEFASGIPGSIGGAAFMNAGAYGGEMKNVIRKVSLLRRDGRGSYQLNIEEMDYGYRHSVLYESGDIVTSVSLHLEEGNREAIADRMRELAQRRNKKQPISYPSAGSFFKRPQGYYAGKLIEDAGLKGLTVGGAQVSPLHAGFIINKGGATASDIEKLMHLVQALVLEHSGVMLEPEVRIIGEAPWL